MGMRPEGLERWGAASIFKESGRLLHKHYRLFLPFFLAFYLPISIAGVFETVFLSTSPSTPLLDANVAYSTVNSTVNTAQVPILQTTDPTGDHSFTEIFSWTLLFLTYVLGTLGTSAVSYITAYLYSPTNTDDDRFIIPKVFKSLPHAFLRIFKTRLWIFLAFLLLCLLSVIIGGILCAIMFATAGWSDPSLLLVFLLFLFLAGTIYLTIVFELAQVIAVLEPGNYGRKALKRSTKLARIGRVWTIIAVALLEVLLSAVLSVPSNRASYAIMSGGMSVWVKVVLGVVVGGVRSVSRVYFGVVSVVMFFVYTARFDAAESQGMPVFKRIDSAEHSYEPIVEGKGSVTYVIS